MRLAVLDDVLPQQLAQDEAAATWKVALATGDLEEFLAKVGDATPDVVVASLAHIPQGAPGEVIDRIREASRAELVVVLYSFAPKETVKHLRDKSVRVIRTPVRVDDLRAAMMGVIVREILGARRAPDAPVPARRYTREQLGRLQEISNSVKCECPNNLAGLVLGLSEFEDYSAGCENQNDEDAAIHRMLYRETARAREIMEAALTRLCEHERIEL